MIAAHVGEHSVRRMCRWLEVAPSGYYARRRRPESGRAQEDRRLTTEIRVLHARTRRSYGSPRITRHLRDEGWPCGRHRVARLMRQEGLRAKATPRFRVTTQSNHEHPAAPDRVQRQFAAVAPNRLWTSDITYVWTREGWLYLAVVLDLYSRRVVGWSMSTRLTSDFVLEALAMAVAGRRPEPGFVFHSDRGIQYASGRFRRRLADVGGVASMSRRGDCFDNAVTESFFGSLKTEWLEPSYPTREEARRDVFEYIELFYNSWRQHSTLGYVSPEQFEQRRQSA